VFVYVESIHNKSVQPDSVFLFNLRSPNEKKEVNSKLILTLEALYRKSSTFTIEKKKKKKRLNIHDWKKIALRTEIAADIENRKSTAGSSEIINKKR